jgi:hypothetical protein
MKPRFYLLLLLPGIALAAPSAERIAKLVAAQKAEAAWELCEELILKAEITDPATREACASARLTLDHGNRAALDALVEVWGETAAAGDAREEAAGLLLKRATERADWLEVYRLYSGTKAAQEAAQKAWSSAQAENTSVALERFRADFRDTPEAAQAQTLAMELAYAETEKIGTAAAWAELAARYPQHPRSEDIQRKRTALGLVAAREAGPEALLAFAVEHPELPEAESLKVEAFSGLVGVVAVSSHTLRRLPLMQKQAVVLPWVPSGFELELLEGVRGEVVLIEGGKPGPLSGLSGSYAGAPIVPSIPAATSENILLNTPFLCQPEATKTLAVQLTITSGKAAGIQLEYPFVVPESCAARIQAAREPATLKLGKRTISFGAPIADFQKAFPEFKARESGELCIGDFVSTLCIEARNGVVVRIKADCSSYDACYSNTSPYNKEGRELLNQLASSWKQDSEDGSEVLAQYRKNSLIGMDSQYVGPESGDPAFSMVISHEGLERLLDPAAAPLARRKLTIWLAGAGPLDLKARLWELGLSADLVTIKREELAAKLALSKPDLLWGERLPDTGGLIVAGTAWVVFKGGAGEGAARDLALRGCGVPYLPSKLPLESILADLYERHTVTSGEVGIQLCEVRGEGPFSVKYQVAVDASEGMSLLGQTLSWSP